MPAVVRVKRRIDEEPLSAFVLNGKKRKLDSEDGAEAADKDEISTILKFAGTINEQDNTATSQFARLNKEAAQQLVKEKSTQRKSLNITERSRQEMRQSLHEQRFRVVNCMRTSLPGSSLNPKDLQENSTEDKTLNSTNATKEITILDIEKQNTNITQAAGDSNSTLQENKTAVETHSSSTSTDSDSGYVYDLYLPENEQQAEYVDMMDDNHLSVRAFDDLIYEDRFNNESDEYDSEDSNQENYIGNDYPDEEDGNNDFEYDEEGSESEGTRNLRMTVEKFIFDDGEEEDISDNYADLSSDDENYNPYQDPYVQSFDAEDNIDFVDDIDFCVADRYGLAYARYKARILKQQKCNESDDSEEEPYHSASENELNST